MDLPDPFRPDLRILGVFDPGVPNKERVIIRPNRQVSLTGVGVAVGITVSKSAGAAPLHDNVFWFPAVTVEPPAWLFLYTGRGEMRQTTVTEKGETALVFHWQRQHTVFNAPYIVPILFQIGFAEVGSHRIPQQRA